MFRAPHAPPGWGPVLDLYQDAHTSESPVPSCSGRSYTGGTGLISTEHTLTLPTWPHMIRSLRRFQRGSKHLQDLELATHSAKTPPQTCQAPPIADGRQKPTHGHTGDPSTPPEGGSIPAGSFPGTAPGHTAGGNPASCHHHQGR